MPAIPDDEPSQCLQCRQPLPEDNTTGVCSKLCDDALQERLALENLENEANAERLGIHDPDGEVL